MREDFAKIYCDTANQGRSDKVFTRRNRRQAKIDPENADSIRSLRKGHSLKYNHRRRRDYNGKPFIKFLRSQVGRIWDDVYSEICSSFPRAVDRHDIDRSIRYHVHLKMEIGPDGVLYFPDTPYYARTDPGRGFYVDPRTGILCAIKESQKFEDSEWKRFRQRLYNTQYYDPSNPLNRYVCVGGIWYLCEFRNPTDTELQHGSFGSPVQVWSPSSGRWEQYGWKTLCPPPKWVDQYLKEMNFCRHDIASFADARYIWGSEIYPTIYRKQLNKTERKQLLQKIAERNNHEQTA